LGLCLQIHSCDDGTSSFPLGATPVSVLGGPLYLRATFEFSDLQFSWSTDGEVFEKIGPVLDAAILSDDHGDHWGFTGTFFALACQDLTGAKQAAEFDFLEIKTS
jgi:xylan 1,4-beta-xylosidase